MKDTPSPKESSIHARRHTQSEAAAEKVSKDGQALKNQLQEQGGVKINI